MRTILLSLGCLAFLGNSAFAGESCSVQLQRTVNEKDKTHYIYVEFSTGGGSIVEAGPITEIAVAIRAHSAGKALEIFKDAAKGGGPATEKLWKKLNGRRQHYERKISYDEFVKALHQVDLKGQACLYGEIPKKRDLKVLAVEENDQCKLEAQKASTKVLSKTCEEAMEKLEKK